MTKKCVVCCHPVAVLSTTVLPLDGVYEKEVFKNGSLPYLPGKRKMKNYKIPITTTLEVELVQKLDEYVKETGVSKTDVINEALREYLERQEKKN
jgi:hypothetical protein